MRSSTVSASLLGAVSLIAFTSQEQAGCVPDSLNTTVTCDDTVTTNTTFPANNPNDRGLLFDSTAVPIAYIVAPGALVSGNGLSISDVGSGANSVTVTNNGTISVDAGNTPT